MSHLQLLAESPLGIPWEEWFHTFKPSFITFGHNDGDKFWVELLTIPIFSAIAGVLTNWTGVLMLFVPINFTGFYMPGVKFIFPWLPRKLQILPCWAPGGIIGFQGFVPARAEKVAAITYDLAIAKIGTLADLIGQMDREAIERQIINVAKPQIRPLVDDIMKRENPQLWRDVPQQIKNTVFERVETELPGISSRAFERIRVNIDNLIDAKLLVIGFLRRQPDVLRDLIQGLGAPELRFMVKIGLLGGPFGVMLALWLNVYDKIPVVGAIPAWLMVLTGAALIGIVVNIIAIKVVFTPGEPQPWYKCIWRQGLLIKRQHAAAADFGHALAYRILTPKNIIDELLYGARGDRAQGLINAQLNTEVHHVLGPLMPAIRQAVGGKEFEQIKAGAGTAALGMADVLTKDEDFLAMQADFIEEFATQKLRELPPDEFGEILLAAIEQDAWLLYAHGGLLGIVVGAIHILIFGA
ncbi:hypothetical protein [Smaragdicoccus niigatensis]|uniref:hypothetical protein n=1 Tax=Smaragdicoccus niigatensis TaxID=359359 RepID=UPI00035E5BF2|nr:hypothetical protein [Smaragdicoccus niigatensis]